jgi:hypothetical protein
MTSGQDRLSIAARLRRRYARSNRLALTERTSEAGTGEEGGGGGIRTLDPPNDG